MVRLSIGKSMLATSNIAVDSFRDYLLSLPSKSRGRSPLEMRSGFGLLNPKPSRHILSISRLALSFLSRLALRFAIAMGSFSTEQPADAKQSMARKKQAKVFMRNIF